MTREPENIDAIISGCIKGSRKSQEQLYRNFYRVMVSLCLRYTKNENNAVEVLNNAFLKVFKNIQRYDPGQATLYTWIRTIVIHSCLDFINAQEKNQAHFELDEAADIHIPAVAFEKMEASELLQLVRQLPSATRAVFNLYVMEGYNHREIGSLLHISEGTSKWHLSEARKSLRQMIEKQHHKHS
ncbi:MAG: RNA polymerase sigma factor [Flavisolibacter sp.]